MNPLLTAVAALAITSVGIGAILAFTQITLAIKINPLVEHLTELLPALNCGACGFSGCAGYATAIAEQGATFNRCTPGGQIVIEKLAAELLDSYAGTGGAVKKREDLHKTAEANKAFAHFRW